MPSPAAPASSVQSAGQAGPAAVSSTTTTTTKKKGNKKKKNTKSAAPAPPPVAAAAVGSKQAVLDPETEVNSENDGAESAPVEEVSEELETTGLGTANSPLPEDDTVPPKPETETELGLEDEEEGESQPKTNPGPAAANGHAGVNGHAPLPTGTIPGATHAKLEAMSQDREALRLEVEQLRRQLESIQEGHTQETTQLRADLDESEAAREHAETQYQTLLNRVEKIKETLGDRLKRDKAELEEAKDRIEDLEGQNEELQKSLAAGREETDRLKDEVQEQGRELTSLRSRSNLSQQNWLKEKDDIARQVQHLKNELESTTAAMGEWEVIAMEERSLRESLGDKVADLEEQVAGAREVLERADVDRDSQARAVDRLQRALQELQETRKRELREMVESTEEQVQALKKRAQEADARAAEAEAAREAAAKELERTFPFEKEVKEKNLLIGKLRHEAIVLNDHLTKALKYIKKTKPEETIDKQLVTNHFLQFLTLDRSDPRKFQILQIMAGLLTWSDEQREKAGLARPGAASATTAAPTSSGNGHGLLRLPSSPFHRTPSSPALSSDFFAEPTPVTHAGGKESLADLWASFLEQSVDEAAGGGGRKDSVGSVTTAGGRG
ncbi:hypothetical protein C8A05DRAFT_14210 [Staphylotrichum tortipilum]|uniref:GRIP domain-containing protein n=1 Tax=Staphylotrichum tortipilum TaxID=2831512 RepID=A0AAN6MP03_9PEZI|nr:hypothetical protein C8A05DRAFT_14210 [Staphylotrichum longicolle]